MARVILSVELDGGAAMEFVETSATSIYGGGQAVLLAQEAFRKLAMACGLTVEESVDTPPEETGKDEAPPPKASAAKTDGKA